MLLEVFTETDDESNALKQALNIVADPACGLKHFFKNAVKDVFDGNIKGKMKKILNK